MYICYLFTAIFFCVSFFLFCACLLTVYNFLGQHCCPSINISCISPLIVVFFNMRVISPFLQLFSQFSYIKNFFVWFFFLFRFAFVTLTALNCHLVLQINSCTTNTFSIKVVLRRNPFKVFLQTYRLFSIYCIFYLVKKYTTKYFNDFVCTCEQKNEYDKNLSKKIFRKIHFLHF